MDFAGRSEGGSFYCGYVVMTETAGADGTPRGFQVHRSEQITIAGELLVDGLPPNKVLSHLPCYLGPELPTAFGAA